jgi:hypothetical protein
VDRGDPSKGKVVRAMFEASRRVELGNGLHGLFSQDRWIEGQSVASAPELLQAVSRRAGRRVCWRTHSLITRGWQT